MRRANWRVVGSVSVLAVAWGALAGDLNPPGGAVASSMKDLVEVEPRIAVNATNTPGDGITEHIISAPGSYYLTGDLVVAAGKAALRFDSSDVVLDLNGFTVSGPAMDADLVLTGASDNITLRNGTIKEGNIGINFASAINCRFENLRIIDTGSTGATLGFRAAAIDCVVENAGGSGFRSLGVLLVRCVAQGSGNRGFDLQNGGTLIACAALDNSLTGFNLGSLSNVNEHYNVIDCQAEGNTGAGFFSDDASRFEGCVASDNSGDGFSTSRGSVLIGCLAEGNGSDGFVLQGRSRIEGCHALDNTEWGIVIGALTSVLNCSAATNGFGGIEGGNNAIVIGNMVLDNGFNTGSGPGIEITGDSGRIDSNTIINNDGDGLDLSAGTTNLYIRNSFTGNGSNISAGAGNVSGGLSNTPATAGPWSNLEH